MHEWRYRSPDVFFNVVSLMLMAWLFVERMDACGMLLNFIFYNLNCCADFWQRQHWFKKNEIPHRNHHTMLHKHNALAFFSLLVVRSFSEWKLKLKKGPLHCFVYHSDPSALASAVIQCQNHFGQMRSEFVCVRDILGRSRSAPGNWKIIIFRRILPELYKATLRCQSRFINWTHSYQFVIKSNES